MQTHIHPETAGRYRKIALWCGLVPSAMGIAVFVGYLALLGGITGRWFWVLMAGQWTIIIGIFLSVVGFVCLLIYKRRNRLGWRSRPVWRGMLILLSNYVLAALFIFIAVKTWSHAGQSYFVQAANHCSAADIRMLSFRDPAGNTHLFGSVAPGEVITHPYQFKGEGAVTYELLMRKTDLKAHVPQQSGVLLGYITSGLETHTTTVMEFRDSCLPKDGAECVKECTATIIGKN